MNPDLAAKTGSRWTATVVAERQGQSVGGAWPSGTGRDSTHAQVQTGGRQSQAAKRTRNRGRVCDGRRRMQMGRRGVLSGLVRL
jgi:hypothetical protein